MTSPWAAGGGRGASDNSISSLLSGEDLAKISAAVLGDDSAMDDIPFFSPAGAQAWRSYPSPAHQETAWALPTNFARNSVLREDDVSCFAVSLTCCGSNLRLQ